MVCFTPFHSTAESATKFEPFTMSVKDAPPAVADIGEIEIKDGTGLSMVKVFGADAPPPGAGLVTVILAAPGEAISLEVI